MKNKILQNIKMSAAAPIIAAFLLSNNAAAQETPGAQETTPAPEAKPAPMVVTFEPVKSDVMVIGGEQSGTAAQSSIVNANQTEAAQPVMVIPNTAAAPVFTALPPGMLPKNTEIPLSLNEILSSKTATAGAIVPFTVTADVMLGDKVAIPKGSIGQATVTDVRKRGGFGKPGILKLVYNDVTLPDGQKIELSGLSWQEGKRNLNIGQNGIQSVMNTGSALGGVGGAGIASVGLVAVGFLVKGDHAEIHPGAGKTVTLAGNTAINALVPAATADASDIDPAAKSTVSETAAPTAVAEQVISAAP